jgi:hypothetical protein
MKRDGGRSFRHVSQVAQGLVLAGFVAFATPYVATQWAWSAVSHRLLTVAGAIMTVLVAVEQLRPLLRVTSEGVLVRNRSVTRRLAWSCVASVELVPQPGARPPKAIVRTTAGELIPIDALTGTGLVTQAFRRWARASVAELNRLRIAHPPDLGGPRPVPQSPTSCVHREISASGRHGWSRRPRT